MSATQSAALGHGSAAKTKNLLTYSGNRVLVEFGGATIGLVQAVRLGDNYGLEPASGVGDIHAIEYVPSRATHTVSVTNMTLFKGNMRDAGVSAVNGDDVLQGLVFDLVVYSKDTGGALRTIKSCSFESGDVDVTAHRITMQSGQFKALDVLGTGL